jgi:hypothetical protein
MPLAPRPTSPSQRKFALNVVLVAAVVDAVFLVGLVIALLAGANGVVGVLGPLFVFGYVYLLYLAATGAMRETWGWSFFALVALTLGPAGAIYGARRMRAEAEAEIAAQARPTRKEERRAATERRRRSGR